MKYSDFGPQSLAWEYIGMEWWQWQSQGDSNPETKYNIKIVIYRDVPLNMIQEFYPIDKNNQWDYRYLEYTNAISFLDKNIAEDVIPEITVRLKKTKSHILKKMSNEYY